MSDYYRQLNFFIDATVPEWYIETPDGAALLAANVKNISFGELVRASFQLTDGEPKFNSSGVLQNPWTAFDGADAVSEVVVDNNFNWWDDCTLQTALTAGTAVSTIAIGNLSAVPRALGSIRLSASEIVHYNAYTVSNGVYTFTLADESFDTASFTPAASYDSGAAVRLIEMPVIVSAENSGTPASGLFAGTLDAANPVYESLIEGNTSISGTQLELSIFVAGRAVFRSRVLFDCLSALNPGEGAEWIRPNVWAASDSRYIQYANLSASASSLPTGSTPTATVTVTGEAVNLAFGIPAGAQGPQGEQGETGDPGPAGADAPEVKIQYSSDGVSFHDAFSSGDTFIRFSTDNGTTWSGAMAFVGADAPEVTIQYSVSGGAGTWHDTLAVTDYFIRFSVDGGTTWSAAAQFKAYPVRYQYGSTASATFHDNFIAGQDKYVKFSSDNGSTWTNAYKFIGDDGRSFVPSATGTYADRDDYDAESQGFSYLVTSGTNEGKIYFKTSDTSGEWSDGLQFTPEGLSLQYSSNGTSWHTTVGSADKYIRFSTDGGDTWSSAALFRGTSTYTYTAYASDSSGNDFSLTRSSDLDYWNWIYSEDEIAQADLTLQTFNTLGTGWTLFQGDDGITYDWLSGTTAPSDSLGKNGDWYLDTNAGNVYLKSSGAWVLKLNIIGKTGAGITLRGAWVSTTSYQEADMVTYQGSAYIAGRANIGVIPGSTGSESDWTLYISKGDAGSDGVTPHIGSNGNWYIGATDTEVHAQGPAGQDGTNGTNGTDGITPTINATNKHWMIGETDTGVLAEATFTNSYVDVTSVNSSNQASFTGLNIIPVGIKAPSAKFYALEKESLTINTSTNTSTLTFDAYLAYENASSFSGTWRVYFAGGQNGDPGTMNVVVSATEPSSPVEGMLWVQV